MNISEFLKIANKKKKLSTKIRLYVIYKQNHHFINNGVLKTGFDSKLNILNNRDSILSAFSKMAFIFDELIRLRIVRHSNQQDSSELLYLLNLVPVNRKIRTFLDWKVFEPEFTRSMSRLFEVRNDVIHHISLDDVNYKPNDTVSLSTSKGFKKFKKDLEVAWRDLIEIYILEQNKINWGKLSQEI